MVCIAWAIVCEYSQEYQTERMKCPILVAVIEFITRIILSRYQVQITVIESEAHKK